MKSSITVAIVAAAGLLLGACETTTSLPYQVSTQNVITAQSAAKASNAKVTLGAFTAAAGAKKPNCRLMGEVDVAPGKSIEVYIRDALQSELFMAGAYDQASPVTITGRLDEVDVNTVGTGSWTVAMTVTSTADPTGYSVTSTYPFASSFSAAGACKNAAAAFNPAVQELLGKVVSNPGFRKLIGA
jgi:hypothetical protein